MPRAEKLCKDCGKKHRLANAKQTRFAEEYVVDLDATAAARRAQYSAKSASSLGYQLLQNPSVSCLIRQLKTEQSKRTAIDADFVLGQLARIAAFDIRKLYGDDGELLPVKDWPEEIATIVAGLETEEMKPTGTVLGYVRKLKLPDRTRALELLARNLGLLKDVKIVHDGADFRRRMAEGRKRAMLEAARSNGEKAGESSL